MCVCSIYTNSLYLYLYVHIYISSHMITNHPLMAMFFALSPVKSLRPARHTRCCHVGHRQSVWTSKPRKGKPSWDGPWSSADYHSKPIIFGVAAFFWGMFSIIHSVLAAPVQSVLSTCGFILFGSPTQRTTGAPGGPPIHAQGQEPRSSSSIHLWCAVELGRCDDT